MSDQMQAEMRGDIKNLLAHMSRIEANQENLSKQLDDACETMAAMPDKCGTGKDHEKRISTLEQVPDKRQGKRKFLAPLVISIIALIASTGIGVISLIVK